MLIKKSVHLYLKYLRKNQSTNLIHFSAGKDANEENRHTFTALKREDRHKKRKKYTSL